MKILIVDDHAIIRAGLKKLLSGVFSAEMVEAETGKQALAAAKAVVFDLMIVDLNLPDIGGIELVTRLHQAATAPILILTMHSEPIYVRRAIDAGAKGFLSKIASPDELMSAARRVVGGGAYVEQELAQSLIMQPPSDPVALAQLSPRDIEILRHLATGKSLAEIASTFGLGYKTVANNCTQIKTKLGVTRTADLLRLAFEAGLSSKAS